MNEQRNNPGSIVQLTMLTFGYTILAISIYSVIVDTSAMADTGLSFQNIFQVFALSLVNSGITRIIAFGKLFKNLRDLWKLTITLILCLIASSGGIVYFRLMAIDSWLSWLWFVSVFVIVFVIAATIAVVKINFDDKRYNRLLTDYKKRQKENPNNDSDE